MRMAWVICLSSVFQAHHVRGQAAEPDTGRDGGRGGLGLLEFPAGRPDRGVDRVDDLVGDGHGPARCRAAQREQRVVPGGLGLGQDMLGVPDLDGCGLLGRVGDHPVRVVGGGVAVEGEPVRA
jgi:hypothetical protein